MTKKYRLYKACKHLFHYETVKHPAMTDILLPLRDKQISAIIALVFFHDFLEGELDKYDDPCHSQASKAVL